MRCECVCPFGDVREVFYVRLSTVVLQLFCGVLIIGFGTGILKALDRVRERALGCFRWPQLLILI